MEPQIEASGPARSEDLRKQDIQHNTHPFTNLVLHATEGPFIIERAEGVYVYGADGRRYLDGMAGLWCTNLGYGNRRLIEAATAQMSTLPYYQQFHHKAHHPSIRLAAKLAELTPAPIEHFLFANSGSEANDTAVKLVWYYNNARGRPEKKKIIARERAYHGSTTVASSLSGLPFMHEAFDLPLPQIVHTTCPDYFRAAQEGESPEAFGARCVADLEARILDEGPDTVAAFIAEPVMGVAGVIPPPPGYWAGIQAVLKKYDILLIADEVITGFGRTGHMFASERFDIAPDLLVMAKGLSSAYFPISALGYSDPIHQTISAKSAEIGAWCHGFTYSGHPVGAAVALETIAVLEEEQIPERVRRVGAHLAARLEALRDLPLVGRVDAVGLMGAVELVRTKSPRTHFVASDGVGRALFELAQDKGVILRFLGDTIVFSPPLIITEDEVDHMVDVFAEALAELARDITT